MDRWRGARLWLLTLWAAVVVAILALNVVWPLPGEDGSWPWVGGLAAFPVAASLILARRPGNNVGRALGVVGVAAAAIFVLSWYALSHPDAPLSRHLEAVEAGAAVLQFAGMIALLFLFPTGRPLPGWSRQVFRLFLWSFGGLVVAAIFRPGPLQLTSRANPLGVGPSWFDAVWDHGFVLLPLFGAAGVVSLFARRRRADAAERAQLKWFATAAVFLLVMLVNAAFLPETDRPVIEVLGGWLVLLAFWSLPVAILIAVTRYRLYDIDRIVSRTVGYAVIASILVSVYAALVVGLQVLVPIGGSDVAIAGSTLVVAALFSPVRRIVQKALDRRFNRARYEAEQVTRQFSQGLRDRVDLDAVTADLCDVVVRTMQPARAHVWLRETDGSDRGGAGRTVDVRPAPPAVAGTAGRAGTSTGTHGVTP